MRSIATHAATMLFGFVAATLLSGYPVDALEAPPVDFLPLAASRAHTETLQGQIDALQAELAMAKSEARVSRSAVDRMRRERADAEQAVMVPVPPDLKEAMYQASEANRLSLSLLVAVCIQESDCKAGEVGAHGEQGPMQVLPATAQDVANRNGLSMADMAGVDGIHVGTRYLRECIDAEGGDVYRGLQAYHRGPNWRAHPEARDYAGSVLGRMISGN